MGKLSFFQDNTAYDTLSVAAIAGNEKMIQFLIEKDFKNLYYSNHALWYAFAFGQIDVVLTLMMFEYGPLYTYEMDFGDKKISCFKIAEKMGHGKLVQTVKKLFTICKEDC